MNDRTKQNNKFNCHYRGVDLICVLVIEKRKASGITFRSTKPKGPS